MLLSLLNVIELVSVVGGSLLDIACMAFQRVCVCCACDPSVRLDAHSICLLLFCMSEVISSFNILRAGACYLYGVSLCDFAYYVVGQEPAVAVHFTLWNVVLVFC